MLATVGLVAVGIIVLVIVLKIAAAIATALFVPLLLIGVGVAIGVAVVSSKGRGRVHFVNLEPVSLEAPGFWERLPRWIEALPFDPSYVVMEFTESQGVHDLEGLQTYANRLRDVGLQIAVDDLGAGVASLSHMARLAPDFIKADRSLVEQVHRRPYQAALLNALSHFAQRMCIGFIAEGIETLEELESVMDADVPWGQGYILGQPWPSRPRPIAGPVAGPINGPSAVSGS